MIFVIKTKFSYNCHISFLYIEKIILHNKILSLFYFFDSINNQFRKYWQNVLVETVNNFHVE